MDKLNVIIPHNGLRYAEFVGAYYETRYPVTYAQDASEPFSKAKAVNAGVKSCGADTLILVDADTLISFDQLERGLASGDPWVIPYDRCLDLGRALTTQLLSGPTPTDLASIGPEQADRSRIKKKYAGGVLIIRRDLFEEAGGFDERYAGWGGEDESFCRAVDTLCRPSLMLPGDIYHLWHRPDPTKAEFKRRHNWRLFLRYRRETGRKEGMRELVKGHQRTD